MWSPSRTAAKRRTSSRRAGLKPAELRPATALFLRFGGLDYDGDEQAGERLDAFVRWVQSVLARREGTLIQLTTGDKGSYLYAAFGAPLAHDDDPARAVAAALELRAPPPDLAFVAPIQIGGVGWRWLTRIVVRMSHSFRYSRSRFVCDRLTGISLPLASLILRM